MKNRLLVQVCLCVSLGILYINSYGSLVESHSYVSGLNTLDKLDYQRLDSDQNGYLQTANTAIDVSKILEVYGSDNDNWGDRSPFAGGYINYGYWKNIDISDRVLSLKDRVASSRELYKQIIEHLGDISVGDVVLEVGCGRGMGMIDFCSWHQVKRIIGVDINSKQLKCASANLGRYCSDKNKYQLICRAADSTLLNSHSIDKIYSLEVAQHFPSMIDFAREMKRLLKPGGKLVFASYFLVNQQDRLALSGLLPLMQERLENIASCDEVCAWLKDAGFENVSYERIGEHVFAGYEKWLMQQQDVAEFSHAYFKAYQAGYLDYYIFTVSV